jgi:hypothetical protein
MLDTLSVPAGHLNGYAPSAETFLADSAARIRALRLRRGGVDDAIEIGRILTACKEKLRHGRWGLWLEDEFKWYDVQTSSRYMWIFQKSKLRPEAIEQARELGLSARAVIYKPHERKLEKLEEELQTVSDANGGACRRLSDSVTKDRKAMVYKFEIEFEIPI